MLKIRIPSNEEYPVVPVFALIAFCIVLAVLVTWSIVHEEEPPEPRTLRIWYVDGSVEDVLCDTYWISDDGMLRIMYEGQQTMINRDRIAQAKEVKK